MPPDTRVQSNRPYHDPANRKPKLNQRQQEAIDFACQALGITRAEFVYQATVQALDEFYSEGP